MKFPTLTKRIGRHHPDHQPQPQTSADPIERMADRRQVVTVNEVEADREDLAAGLGVLTERGVRR